MLETSQMSLKIPSYVGRRGSGAGPRHRFNQNALPVAIFDRDGCERLGSHLLGQLDTGDIQINRAVQETQRHQVRGRILAGVYNKVLIRQQIDDVVPLFQDLVQRGLRFLARVDGDDLYPPAYTLQPGPVELAIQGAGSPADCDFPDDPPATAGASLPGLSRYLQHPFERHKRQTGRLLINRDDVDRRSGRQVLKAPTEMGQIDPVHRRTHADDG